MGDPTLQGSVWADQTWRCTSSDLPKKIPEEEEEEEEEEELKGQTLRHFKHKEIQQTNKQ